FTFDDGPSARTLEIADILTSRGARGTFFVIGRHIPSREHVLRKLVAEGHELGNHSFSHRQVRGRPIRTAYQIVRAGRRIRAVTGSAPHLFRPPHGRYDPWVLRAARLTGATVVNWSLDPRDWATGTTPSQLHDRLTEAVTD